MTEDTNSTGAKLSFSQRNRRDPACLALDWYVEQGAEDFIGQKREL